MSFNWLAGFNLVSEENQPTFRKTVRILRVSLKGQRAHIWCAADLIFVFEQSVKNTSHDSSHCEY